MHFVYLGTHELGHTFDLKDCLFNNGCTNCSAGNCSIMGGFSLDPLFNTGGSKEADKDDMTNAFQPFKKGTVRSVSDSKPADHRPNGCSAKSSPL